MGKLPEYTFNVYNSLAPSGEVVVLKRMLGKPDAAPVIACIGSDLSVGDSLGPIVGTKLIEKLRHLNVYVYGCLAKPLTAHEIRYTNEFIRSTHPTSPIIAVDAAVGAAGDVGLIKIVKGGLRPGSGANKKLTRVGDVSIMGIVAEKSMFNYSLFSSTRLNLVYKMSEIISDGIADYIVELLTGNKKLSEKAEREIV